MPQPIIEKQIKELDEWVLRTKAVEYEGRYHNELKVLIKYSVNAGYTGYARYNNNKKK